MDRSEIIGQDVLLDKFDNLIENNALPHLIIISGEKGSGRKLCARYIADKINATLVRPEEDRANTEYVAKVVEDAYKQTEPIVYLIPDFDGIRIAAKDKLLKVTEEPPKNAYFIITTYNGHRIKDTIKSRSSVFSTFKYSVAQLREFAEAHGVNLGNKTDRLFNILSTPGDILNMASTNLDYDAMEKFANMVINNIGEVSGSNAFKIAEKISFKEDDEGFNLQSFWIMCSAIAIRKAKESLKANTMYLEYVKTTSSYVAKLNVPGINKKSLFDLWILDMREVYLTYN